MGVTMTDESTTAAAQAGGSDSTNGASDPDLIIGLVTDGAHTLLVAQFPTMEDAEAAYRDLQEIERNSPLKIDGVVIASCDAEGKVHLGKVTEHSTKTGFKWGVVGGAVLGVIFPPSILASAAVVGGAGAVLGKARNVLNRRGLADQLAGAMRPNTAGIVALVENTAVVEMRKALAKADRIVEQAVDKQLAAEIDREAAAAKASSTSA
jgi:uncharacterized membrane protein